MAQPSPQYTCACQLCHAEAPEPLPPTWSGRQWNRTLLSTIPALPCKLPNQWPKACAADPTGFFYWQCQQPQRVDSTPPRIQRHAGQPDVECLGWKQNWWCTDRSKPQSWISRSNWTVRSDTPWFPSLVSSNESVRCQSRPISGCSPVCFLAWSSRLLRSSASAFFLASNRAALSAFFLASASAASAFFFTSAFGRWAFLLEGRIVAGLEPEDGCVATNGSSWISSSAITFFFFGPTFTS